MPTLTTLSLSLNIAVLIPVCIGLLANAAWTRKAYGERLSFPPVCGHPG